MEKDPVYYHSLLSAYIDNKLSVPQVEELLAFIAQEPLLYRSLLDSPDIQQKLKEVAASEAITISDAVSERMLERLLSATATVVKMRRPWLQYAKYAAAVVILLGIAVFVHEKNKQETVVHNYAQTDIRPGGNKATLTLANGRIISLDSAANGVLTREGATSIAKQAGEQLVYTATPGSGPSAAGVAAYNTITTPRGGQYQLILPDGTKVWLNAASDLRYPTAFTGKDRTVTLRGEAYFEVASDKAKPFRVSIGDSADIDVLGTHFNVNAYTDEPDVRTTLSEGSVKVSKDGRSVRLSPGQQARLITGQQSLPGTDPQAHPGSAAATTLSVTDHADLDQVMAWKNGSFLFDRTSLDVVMRQLSRWYDIDVVYEKGIPPVRFAGEMKRDLNLSEVLTILKKMEVHCHMEERKLIVSP